MELLALVLFLVKPPIFIRENKQTESSHLLGVDYSVLVTDKVTWRYLLRRRVTDGFTPFFIFKIMECKFCGKEIIEDSKFCNHCGNTVEEENQIEIATKRPSRQNDIRFFIYLFFIVCSIHSINKLYKNEKREDRQRLENIESYSYADAVLELQTEIKEVSKKLPMDIDQYVTLYSMEFKEDKKQIVCSYRACDGFLDITRVPEIVMEIKQDRIKVMAQSTINSNSIQSLEMMREYSIWYRDEYYSRDGKTLYMAQNIFPSEILEECYWIKNRQK